MITSERFESQFHKRNMVMRAMSRLVWLKTKSLLEVEAQAKEVDQESKVRAFKS